MSELTEYPYSRIYAVVELIPVGRVATYGQIAAMAGLPGHARQVGYALRRPDAPEELPWHRVLNARGEISYRGGGPEEAAQRRFLEQEGVAFDERARVDLERFGWRPRVEVVLEQGHEGSADRGGRGRTPGRKPA